MNQCIFCKYKNDKDKCRDHILNDPTWHCPTLSNIYYGKLINYFPFNMMHKLDVELSNKKIERYYADFNKDFTENSEVKFIYGIKSYVDLTTMKCNLLTMNDFDLVYFKDTKKYVMGVETFISFNTDKECQNYMKSILDNFTKWMKENNYDTTKELDMYEVFTEGININTEFDTIEQAYAAFKFFVRGFKGKSIM